MTNHEPGQPKDGGEPRARILACLGSIANEEQTIDAALALAEALRAEVAGCFVEESNLLDLAALPFARTIRPTDTASAPLDLPRMQRHIAGAAAQWKRTLGARAERSRIAFTFSTLRGEYCTEIARAAAATDIVVVNPANVAGYGRSAVAAILAAVRDPAITVLLPDRRPHSRGGLVVVVAPEGNPAADAVRLADRIASMTGSGILVAAMEAGETSAEAIRAAASKMVHGALRVRQLPGSDIASVAAVLAEIRPAFVIWPPGPTPPGNDVEILLRAAGAPLLLMRPGRGAD